MMTLDSLIERLQEVRTTIGKDISVSILVTAKDSLEGLCYVRNEVHSVVVYENLCVIEGSDTVY